jgi:hypothetical protein
MRTGLVTIAIALAGCASTARADLGAPVLDRSAGRLRVVAFASPVPLRVGPTDWTLLVVDGETSEPVRDVDVQMQFARHDDDPHAAHGHSEHPKQGALEVAGTRARVEFDAAGLWHFEISLSPRSVDQGDAAEAASGIEIRETLEVLPRQGFWRRHGAAVIAPYGALVAFAIQQVFAARRRRGSMRRPS